jgi:hypothetical protein
MNYNNRFRKPQASFRTSNGKRLQNDVAAIKVNLMANFKAKSKV